MSLPRLLPKPVEGQAPNPPPAGQAGKRKRGPHHTACNYCRLKREKCSGLRPRCQTCERQGVQCIYEVPQGVTRQQANKQKLIESQRSSSSLREVVELLRHGSEVDAALALNRIRQAENVDEAVNVLSVAQVLLTTSSTPTTAPGSTSAVDTTSAPGPSDRPATRLISHRGLTGHSTEYPEFMFERGFAQSRDRYNEDNVIIDLPAMNLPISRWTSACKDNHLMNHLLALFWTWDNIVERSLFRPLFEEDLSNNDPQAACNGRHDFCSPFLVNALLAVGCMFTTESATFADADDMRTRGRQFADEAEKCYEKEKERTSLPLMQGQYAMFVYEGTLGSGHKSMKFFMETMATHGALNDPNYPSLSAQGKSESRLQREKEGLSWIMWGLYCSEWRATQALGARKLTSKPLLPKLWRSDDFCLNDVNSASYWWFPYPVSLRTQRSMQVEIREVDSNLSEIAEDVLAFLYPPSDGLAEPPLADPQTAINLYNTIVQWKVSLPARLRLEDAVQPCIILLHSYADVLLAGVLRPFSSLTKDQFGPFRPKERCYAHCTSLMDTIWTFRAFASLNTEYWFMHILGTIAFVTFREHADNPVLAQTTIKACKGLLELTERYPLAADVLTAIRGAFKIAGMPVPTYLQTFLGGAKHRRDGLLHHAAGSVLPSEERTDESAGETRYQALLDELDSVGLD